MPKPGAASALLAQLKLMREEVEALDDPGRIGILAGLRILKDQLEAVEARAQSEASRARKGIGAAARFSRLR